MPDPRALRDTAATIHRAIERIEFAVSRLDDDLCFLVCQSGDVELVRRAPTGEILQPKQVVARLEGFDPMLWRPESRRSSPLLIRMTDIEPPLPGPGVDLAEGSLDDDDDDEEARAEARAEPDATAPGPRPIEDA